MKTFSILFLFLFTTETKASEPNTPTNFYFNGSELFITYFMANQLSYEAGDNSGTVHGRFQGGFISEYYVPSVGYRWDYIRNDGFGFNLGSRLEIQRSFTEFDGKQFDGTTSSTLSDSDSMSLSFLVNELNITHTIDKAYWFIGPNYPLVVSKTGAGRKVRIQNPGFQAGLGWNLGRKISNLRFGNATINFEFFIQIINFELKALGKSSYGQATLPGIGLKWGFNF